jgi:hypothetical protein
MTFCENRLFSREFPQPSALGFASAEWRVEPTALPEGNT